MKNHFHLLLYPLLFYFSITTLNAQCPPPTGITLTSVGYSHFAFNWDNEPNITYNVRYRLQGASSWVNLTDYSSHLSGNKIPCSTYEWQVQSVCNSTPGPWSTLEIVNTLGCGDLYCYSYGLSWDHWIESVAFSDMSNGSGNEHGHADFNSQVANVEQGQSYVIALDPDTDVASTTVYWNVWIDWNADNDFNDSGELVVSKTGNSQNLSTETINIPANATIGITRMRVTLSPTAFATNCQTGGSLDVEDYSINIQPPPCSIPTGFVVDDVGYAIVDLGWQAVPGATAYQTRRRLVGAGSWETGSWYTSTGVLWGNSDPCSTYEFQVRTDCNGFYSDYSSSIFATTEGCGDPYCYSYGLSWDHWVESVGFSDLSQPSGNGYGFTDYTSSIANVEKGGAYSITLDPDTDVASTTVYWRVWIDWNADNDFDDSGEQVVSVSGNSQTATTEIIAIPTSATIGVTRMRVALSPTAFSTTCQTGGSLDVEDYSVNILPQPCSVPSGLNVDDTGYAVVELSWQPVTGATAYQTRRRLSGTSTWQDGSWFTGTSVLWGNSEPCSTYEFQVRADCNGAFSDYSNSTFGITEGCGDPYCYSYGLSWDHWIESVDMADMSQASGNGYGYANYTSITANVEKGETYVITLGDDSDVASTTVYWQVWIDWNADNDFDDSGEQVVSLSATSVNQSTQNIVVPTNAVLGPTRMRVSLSPTSFATTCQEGGNLDVEDYSVNILPEPCAVPTGFMVDDVGYAVVDLNWQPVSGATAYQTRRRLSGTSTWELGNWFTTTSVFWGNSDPCSTYEFQVRTDCNGTFSDFSNSIFATTEGCGDPYCYSYGLSWDHWIESVGFADLSQPSGNGYGYTDFTSATANVQQTETYSISLDPDTDVAPTTVYWQVWVDWNADNDFEDDDELVITNSGDSQSAITESITIPATAVLGMTRMRVALSPSTFATNCQIGGSLDVEDYSVNINPPPPFLIATPPDVNFVEQGGIQIISVSSNVSWTATETESWLSVSPDNGSDDGSFTITCDANPDFNPRSGSIEVQGAGIIQIITVTQQAASPSLAVNPNSVSFSGTGGNETITVDANIGWTVTENASWLSVDPDNGSGNGSFVISCTANPNTTTRSAVVTVEGGGLSEDVVVTQQAGTVILDVMPVALSVDVGGGNQSLNVTSNASWTASTTANWFSLDPDNGVGNGSITVTCSPNTSVNARQSTILVTAANITRTVTVTQSGMDNSLVVSPDTMNFAAGTDASNVFVTSNVDWIATENASWLSLDNEIGTNNGFFTINCVANNTSNGRSTTVSVNGGGLTATVFVYQEPQSVTLNANPAAFNVDAQNDCVTSNITSNVDWSIINPVPWVSSVTPSSGSNNATITICYTTNNSATSRTGTLQLSGGGLSQNITITQAGQPNDDISFDPANVVLDWQGTAVTGTVNANNGVAWTASASDSWLELDQTSGTGSGPLMISSSSPNSGSSPRSGTVTLNTATSSFVINVTQAAEVVSGPPWGEPEATIMSGSMIGQIQINGVAASAGDWIAAFDEDNNLAGSQELIINQGIAYMNLVIYGDDSNTPIDEGINPGEAFILKLYDASENRVLDYPNSSDIFLFTEWANTNGAPMPAYNSPNDIYNFEISSLSFSPATINLDWIGSDVTGDLTIDMNQTWTATPSDSWIAVSPGNGLGSQAVVISATSTNTTGAIRSGSIEFSGGGSSVTVTVSQAQQLNDGPPWGNPETTIASGALIGQIQINGEPAEAGDWIAAFDENNNLAGSKEVIINQGIAYTNLVIYGDDTNTAIDEGINQGEAFTLRLYDASESRILEYPNSGAVFSFTEWMNTNGAPMPAYNSPNDIYNFATVSYDTIPLKAGWNLVSTDVSPADSSVSAIVSSLIPGNLEYVTGFDGVANFYDPGLPDIFSTLTHWKPGFGYWVKVFQDDMLILEGQQIEPSYFKPMDDNWNLIAYLPQAAQAPETYLSDFISEGQLEYVTGFDDVFEFYDPFGLPFLNTLSEMKNAKGYWVKLQNLGQQPDVDGTPGLYTIHNLPNPNYEFILGHTDAPEGAILDLVDENGTIWTQFEVAQGGMLMPKALYSDDESTPLTQEGPPVNTWLNFKWNDLVSPLGYQPTADLEVHEVEVNFGLNADHSLLVSPTPFRDELQIRLDLPVQGEASVRITDVNGNLVWQSPLNPQASGTQYITWRPEGQSSGVYFISLYQMGRPVARTKTLFVR
jgi:hypothetical protein